MFRRRVTCHTLYPASSSGRNCAPDSAAKVPCGTSLPGPPGIQSTVLSPVPHRAKSIVFGKVPVSGTGIALILDRTDATAIAASAAVPIPTTAVRFFTVPV